MDSGSSHHSSQLGAGAIAGIVIGILGFICIKSVIIYWACQRRRSRISRQQPAKRMNNKEEAEAFLRQLKEHEFACHDIKICVDNSGQEILLGVGGFGRVLLGARNEHQPVAIKQMLNPDRKAKSEFMKEIKLLKHVSLDANIVQYFGACFPKDQLWLVTEFMEGGDLRRALAAGGIDRLTWWIGGKQIALDVARGLIFLHSRGVIHGDLKSHNILLTSEGKAKIADVGMAQIVSEDAASVAEQAKHGTLAWAAPELLVKESRCTEKVDIFSFGVCLWEIVTSQIPQRGDLFPPSADACPPAINSLIQDCIKERPQDRPSAKEIYRRLVACEPYHPDFGGLLDSAEGGGRRSQAIPRGRQLGQRPHEHRLNGIKASLQAFINEPPTPTFDEVSEGEYVAIELSERPRKSAEQFREQGIMAQLSGSIDEKVEFTSQSPRYYKPEAAQALPGNLGKPRQDLTSLPDSNIAFTKLVAKFTQANPEIDQSGAVDDIQDTAILSTVDADLSHIPSLHNTMTLDPLTGEERTISLDSKDNEAISAWLDPSQDIFSTASQEAANPMSSPDEMAIEPHNDSVHGEGATETSTEDEMESAAVESVQGYAGSESSSRSKIAYEESASQRQLPVHSQASSISEEMEYEADLTSHHLEVAQANVNPSSKGSYESYFPEGKKVMGPGNTSMDGQATSNGDEASLRSPREPNPRNSLGQSSRAWWQSSSNNSDWEDDTSLSLYSADSFRVLSLD